MTTDLTLDLVQSQLRPKQKLIVSEETVQEIQKLAEDPEYGPEFLNCYIDHLNILKESPRNNHEQYLCAIKFFSLVESGNSLTDAYIKTFPNRWNDRQRNHDDAKKDIMRGEASRYNSTQMVNEIRKIAAIPVQLIHRHILHAAILKQADLMENGKSEFVRQKAAACLITELKPTEDQTINVDVKDGASSVIAELHKAAKALAVEQHRSVMAGIPLKQITESKIISSSDEEILEGEIVNE